MKKHIYLPAAFFLFAVLDYLLPLKFRAETSSLFLTVSTFIFAILAGFFIARQSNRYTSIRSTIAVFDGNVSALHRSFASFGEDVRRKAAEIIKRHYDRILETKRWDHHFTHKSTTITDLGSLLRETAGETTYPSLKNMTINHMAGSLDSLQVARKEMVSLHTERMPMFEWVVVSLLAALLLFSLMIIPSESAVFGAFMKGVFGTMVILVVTLLRDLDTLNLFEGTLGESSAKDMLNIIAGTR